MSDSDHDGRAGNSGRETPNNSGWVTFEARVRGRRFARCLERADEAINLGQLSDAREALTEAKTLWPDAPEIAQFESRIDSVPNPNAVFLTPDVARVEPDSGWRGLVAATAVLLALFSLAGFGLLRLHLDSTDLRPVAVVDNTTSPPAEVSASKVPASGEADGASSGSGSAPQPDGPILKSEKPIQEKGSPEKTPPQSPAGPAAQQPGRDRTATRPAIGSSVDRSERSTATGTAGAGRLRAPSGGMRLRDEPAAPRPSAPAIEERRPAEPAPPMIPSTISDSAPASAGSVSPVTPILTPVSVQHAPPSARLRPDESGIRSALSRYEAAYNSLDAKAATSVWPGVDQRALGRAFDGLLSQRVSLGLCDITVIGDIGGATCAGKARWEPKVGGGLQTADRYWNFHLRRTGDGWKIQEIRVH